MDLLEGQPDRLLLGRVRRLLWPLLLAACVASFASGLAVSVAVTVFWAAVH